MTALRARKRKKDKAELDKPEKIAVAEESYPTVPFHHIYFPVIPLEIVTPFGLGEKDYESVHTG
jgi:hypothetical protein